MSDSGSRLSRRGLFKTTSQAAIAAMVTEQVLAFGASAPAGE